MRAVQMIAERLGAPVFARQVEIQAAFTIVEGLLEGVGDALPVLGPQHEPIDDNLQRLSGRCLFHFIELANPLLDQKAMKAGLAQSLSGFAPGQR